MKSEPPNYQPSPAVSRSSGLLCANGKTENKYDRKPKTILGMHETGRQERGCVELGTQHARRNLPGVCAL